MWWLYIKGFYDNRYLVIIMVSCDNNSECNSLAIQTIYRVHLYVLLHYFLSSWIYPLCSEVPDSFIGIPKLCQWTLYFRPYILIRTDKLNNESCKLIKQSPHVLDSNGSKQWLNYMTAIGGNTIPARRAKLIWTIWPQYTGIIYCPIWPQSCYNIGYRINLWCFRATQPI